MQDGKSANYLLPVGMITLSHPTTLCENTNHWIPKMGYSILGGEAPVAIGRTSDCSPIIPDSLARCIEPILYYTHHNVSPQG